MNEASHPSTHQWVYDGPSQRIDLYLSRYFPYSRNFFHHLLERGVVLVNGKPVKKSYQIVAGQTITIEDFQRFLDGGILEESPAIPIDIRHEAEDYLVIYKPKGLLSHPNSIWDVKEPNVVGAVYHRYEKKLTGSQHFLRAGLIHRLDKETDGLMIIAKTEKGLAHFKALFQAKSEASTRAAKEAVPLHKFYKASCYRTPAGNEFLASKGSVPRYIEELVVPKIPHAVPKMGVTKVLDIHPRDDLVDLELEILTGRTHQIRYHLSHHGLPIAGDYLYGKDDGKSLQLTAWKLIFQDLAGEIQTINI